MEDLLACRACLITEGKLFDMVKHKLVEPYEILTGTQVSTDSLPRHLCSICAALLQKSVSFRKKCDSAQHILKYALKQEQKLTTSIIKKIDRDLHSLKLPLTITTLTNTLNVEEREIEVKEEDNTDFDIDTLIIKCESDDEPLSRTSKRKRTKLKKEYQFVSYFDNFSDDETGCKNDENGRIDGRNDVSVGRKHENGRNDESVGRNVENGGNNDNVGGNDENGGQNEVKTTDEWAYDIDVIVLSKDEQINEVVARKHSSNYLRSHYKCDLCFRGFISDVTFNNHMAKHAARAGPHECDVCHTRWRTASALRVHSATSHERKYVCRKCRHVANSSHAAKEHSRWHLGFKYTCKICGATFFKSSSHLTHLRIQHPSEHRCELCSASFIGEYGLAMHRKKTHREHAVEGSKMKTECLCVKCGLKFRGYDALERHTSAAGNCSTDLRPCLNCGEGFSTKEQLLEHSIIHKDGVWCKECNRTFAHQKSYATHYHRMHLRDKSTRDVTGNRAVCEVCGKKCVSAAALRYHQRAHSGERPYPCSVCPKRFAMPLLLQNHLRTHTGERPYQCPRCPKAFSNRAALVRHNRVHTGVKPYPCPECDKCFTQSNSRKLHISTVHRKQPAPYKRRKEAKNQEST